MVVVMALMGAVPSVGVAWRWAVLSAWLDACFLLSLFELSYVCYAVRAGWLAGVLVATS
jgi:hypothetical protein